jgi:hypothetical protein
MPATSTFTITKVVRNKNRDGAVSMPWLVYCAVCSGDDFFSALMPKLLGWTRSWFLAYHHAREHALAHEARRCTTCLHLPTGPLPPTTPENHHA